MQLFSPVVNTDTPMPKLMLEALTLHETFCVMSNINAVTIDQVQSFLGDRLGAEFANTFKPEYLFSSPKPSADHA